jgi:signal transduction histidine kinase
MSLPPFRRPLAIVATAALGIFLLLRCGVLLWSWQQAPADNLLPWVLDTFVTGVVVLASLSALGWLTNRVRRQDTEQSRLTHLAEVGLMASGLTHEIRNILNALQSHVALLRKQLPSDVESPAWRRTDQVEHALGALDELVRDFLAYARPAADRLEDINIAELLKEVLDFVALDLEQSQVKMNVELNSVLPTVRADATKLKRAVMNLIINARQAMPDGGVLTVRLGDTDRNDILIEISDTGCGIPDTDRPRIFETFFSTKPEGTGLGLAVVRRTVEDCGGQVSFVSEVGRGTTFRILLPRAGTLQFAQKHQGSDSAVAIVTGNGSNDGKW